MITHKILKGQAARQKLADGIKQIADAVVSTLGPRGRNVVIQTGGLPIVTKDGVTVAQSIRVTDPGEFQGAALAVQASVNTNEKVGDGTTTSMALVADIVNKGIAALNSSIGSLDLQSFREGIQAAVESSLKHIKEQSRKIKGIEDIKRIATISANNNEQLGTLVADTIEKVGENGIVTVEESQGTVIEVEHAEGTQFDRGLVSPFLIVDKEDRSTTMKAPDILMSNERLDSVQDLFNFLNNYLETTKKKELVVIADDFSEAIITSAIGNRLKGLFTLALVRCPGYGDRKLALMEDLAVMTGATLINSKTGVKLTDLKLEHLGSADKVTMSLDDTVIINGSGDAQKIKERVKEIESELKKSTSEFDKSRLKERIGKLLGKVASIKVGASSEAEAKELKYLVEDSVSAVRSALRSGITAGGGVALLSAYEAKSTAIIDPLGKSKDYYLGFDILYESLRAPATHLVTNCGQSPKLIEDIIRRHGEEPNAGYDGKNDVVVKDMFVAGIVDPYEVSESAIRNAASVAFTVLSTEILAYEQESKDDATPTRP